MTFWNRLARSLTWETSKSCNIFPKSDDEQHDSDYEFEGDRQFGYCNNSDEERRPRRGDGGEYKEEKIIYLESNDDSDDEHLFQRAARVKQLARKPAAVHEERGFDASHRWQWSRHANQSQYVLNGTWSKSQWSGWQWNHHNDMENRRWQWSRSCSSNSVPFPLKRVHKLGGKEATLDATIARLRDIVETGEDKSANLQRHGKACTDTCHETSPCFDTLYFVVTLHRHG